MSKRKEPVITVRVVYAGQQTEREAFIKLIIEKEKAKRAAESRLDYYADCLPRDNAVTRRRTPRRNRA